MTQQTTPSITSVNVGNVPAAFGQFIGNYSIDNPPICKTTPKLALTPKPLVEIVYGTALGVYLDATATYNGQTVPGNFVYTDETGAIATKQSALSVGTHTLTATFTPTDTTYYTSGGTIQNSITVNSTAEKENNDRDHNGEPNNGGYGIDFEPNYAAAFYTCTDDV